MTSLKRVIDTNNLISAALSSQGAPAKLVQWALAQHRLVFTQVTFKALLQAPEVLGLLVVSVHEALRALAQ